MGWIIGIGLMVFAGLFWWALTLQESVEDLRSNVHRAFGMIEANEKETDRLLDQMNDNMNEMIERHSRLRSKYEAHVNTLWAHVPPEIRTEVAQKFIQSNTE